MKPILIGCEFSGIVREAFREKGYPAVSCDLISSERSGPHIQGDIIKVIYDKNRQFSGLIAFPPCTYLASSGARWFKDPERQVLQLKAVEFVRELYYSRIQKVCIENPIGRLSTLWKKPDQIIQPWQYGHGEIKSTCLWEKGLPLLRPTKIVEGRIPRVHYESPSPDRWKNRSRTLPGIANAMADQWGPIFAG